jgi:hypothetical protein
VGIEVTEFLRKEHVRPVLRLLIRTVMVVVIILLLDVMGLWFFLFSRGQWNLLNFTELLTILLLVEGSLIGVAGAFMFVGYSEYRIAGQGAINPAIVADQRQRWRKRRLSQQKWGIAMLIASFLLVFLGLLVSLWTSL